MYRTDHEHRWQPTDYVPMSSSYARTLYDDSALLMTGDTRPAPFGHTKDGDLVEVKRSGFAVDIDSDYADLMPLDVLAQRFEPGTIITDMQAEIAAARMAGAAMDDPVPTRVVEAWTPARIGDALGSVVGWGIVTAMAVGAWTALVAMVAR